MGQILVSRMRGKCEVLSTFPTVAASFAFLAYVVAPVITAVASFAITLERRTTSGEGKRLEMERMFSLL